MGVNNSKVIITISLKTLSLFQTKLFHAMLKLLIKNQFSNLNIKVHNEHLVC